MARVRNGKQAKNVRRENAARELETTPEDQIKILDARLGVGVGAVKERARLAKPVG